MTRKHYIELAKEFARVRPYVAQRSTKQQRAEYEVWHECRGVLMGVLKRDNTRFDRERFIAATEQ